jgi:fibronectin type 3 domain-containing protein
MKFLLIALLVFPLNSATLSWNQNPEPEVNSYRVFTGSASRSYRTNFVVTTTNTVFALTNLVMGSNYFAVTAISTNGIESDLSAEVFFVRKPSSPSGVQVSMIIEGAQDPSGPWTQTTNSIVQFAIAEPKQFYRTRLQIVALQ